MHLLAYLKCTSFIFKGTDTPISFRLMPIQYACRSWPCDYFEHRKKVYFNMNFMQRLDLFETKHDLFVDSNIFVFEICWKNVNIAQKNVAQRQNEIQNLTELIYISKIHLSSTRHLTISKNRLMEFTSSQFIKKSIDSATSIMKMFSHC